MTETYNGCRLHVSDEQGTSSVNIDRDADFAADAADLMEDGEWGIGGARVEYRWYVTDAAGDIIADGNAILVVEPDHDALIRHAVGDTECEHRWTTNGEGGCRENPGVWSLGGTAMLFRSHCRICGLRRTEHVLGSQRNPGDCDTVEYEQPTTWCQRCECEECEC